VGRRHRCCFTLARFSEAFLVLRAQQAGPADCLGATCPSGNERRLRPERLSLRQTIRQHEPLQTAGMGTPLS
jgi:hypothetical protein